jgi:hypothetical protein
MQWDPSDVETIMSSSLASVMSHYLPANPEEVIDYNPSREYRSITQGPPKPHTPFFKELAHIELWKNNYGITSYGCCLNVRKDQILWTNRISRYGFDAPPTSSLDVEGWTITENATTIEMRIVSEMCQRIGVHPEAVDSDSLSRILVAKINKPGPWISIPKPFLPRRGDYGRLLNNLRLVNEGSSWARRQVYVKWFPWEVKNRLTYPVFVKGWGQYIRKGMLPEQQVEVIPGGQRGPNVKLKQRLDKGWLTFEQEEEEEPTHPPNVRRSFPENATEDEDFDKFSTLEDSIEKQKKEAESDAAQEEIVFTPPPQIIQQTIEWSSADFIFHPRIERDVIQRITFSPSEISDVEFLDPPPPVDPEKLRSRELLESQKRVIAAMRSNSESSQW